MRRKRPIRTMIVDDDEGARSALRELLRPHHNFEVVAIAHDGRDALHTIERIKPDLVFMDIDMPHMSGLDVARNLRNHKPLIIFATAFDRYAIHAFDVNAIDYILKPVTKDRIEKSLVRAMALWAHQALHKSHTYEQFLLSQESFAHARKITFLDASEMFILDMDGISCIETEGRYVRVFHDSASHLFEETLASIYSRLDKEHFVYASRGCIINLAHVKSLTRLGVRRFTVFLDDPVGKEVGLSRSRIDDVRARLVAIKQ